jgi:hypothetical protein
MNATEQRPKVRLLQQCGPLGHGSVLTPCRFAYLLGMCATLRMPRRSCRPTRPKSYLIKIWRISTRFFSLWPRQFLLMKFRYWSPLARASRKNLRTEWSAPFFANALPLSCQTVTTPTPHFDFSKAIDSGVNFVVRDTADGLGREIKTKTKTKTIVPSSTCFGEYAYVNTTYHVKRVKTSLQIRTVRQRQQQQPGLPTPSAKSGNDNYRGGWGHRPVFLCLHCFTTLFLHPGDRPGWQSARGCAGGPGTALVETRKVRCIGCLSRKPFAVAISGCLDRAQ